MTRVTRTRFVSAATPRRPRRHDSRARGVTLIEVLIVVTILGIAASIVVPSLLRPGQMTIQGAARLIIGDILMAQNEAVAHAAPRRIQFDLTGNGYRLTDSSGTTLPTPWMKHGYKVAFDTVYRFDGVSLDKADFGGNDWVEFDEMGGTTTGGTVEVVSDGFRYRVTVKPFTGRVSVAPVP